MPGPVSDSYDPEFGTSANKEDVYEALKATIKILDQALENSPRREITLVARGPRGRMKDLRLWERDLRMLRWSAHRTLEEL
jgi:hypothetical protein